MSDQISEEQEAFEWMIENLCEYKSCTQLAEACAVNYFDSPEWLDDENHWIWDIAFQVWEG